MAKTTSFSKSVEQLGTAGKIVVGIMKTIPYEWILPPIFDEILNKIKKDSRTAKVLKPILVGFGKSLAARYPGEICENSTEE